MRNTLQNSMEFWLKHAPDRRFGGIYTSLDEDGTPFSTDKSVWMQGRGAWTFARFARTFPNDPLAPLAAEIAVSCADFAARFCRIPSCGGRMCFSVTADGKPLRKRRYHFSESFFAMGCAEVYRLTGEERFLGLARSAYTLIDRLEHGETDPFAHPPKTEPGTRRLCSLAVPMIRLNLAMEMEDADPDRVSLYRTDAAACVHRILTHHFRRDLRATLENVTPDGDFLSDVSEGRLVNPGHSAECAGFLLRFAQRTGDRSTEAHALDMLRFAWEGGWDEKYGGIRYFADALGRPVDLPEQSMKLWWVHTDAMAALYRGMRTENGGDLLPLFNKVREWAFAHFPDKRYGEWYGYLERNGDIASTAKGGMFKGPFHLPRAMMEMTEE